MWYLHNFSSNTVPGIEVHAMNINDQHYIYIGGYCEWFSANQPAWSDHRTHTSEMVGIGCACCTSASSTS